MGILVGLHAGAFIGCCVFVKYINDMVKKLIVEWQGLFE